MICRVLAGDEWKGLIGKRVLVKERLDTYGQEDCIPMEVSPSGEFVALNFVHGTRWYKSDKFELIEVLEGPARLFCKSPCPYNITVTTPFYYQYVSPPDTSGSDDQRKYLR